eukprot:scaffold5096_cov116-Isochrysis_galbana.AAC.6
MSIVEVKQCRPLAYLISREAPPPRRVQHVLAHPPRHYGFKPLRFWDPIYPIGCSYMSLMRELD